MEAVKPGIGILDSAITKAILPTLPVWHAAHCTPNTLTTLGMASSAACVYFLYRRNFPAALGFLVARVYFDYADGLLARKYDQTSVVGDWYDHAAPSQHQALYAAVRAEVDTSVDLPPFVGDLAKHHRSELKTALANREWSPKCCLLYTSPSPRD